MIKESNPIWVDASDNSPAKIIINNAGGVKGAVITFEVTALDGRQTQLRPILNDVALNNKHAMAALKRWIDEIVDASQYYGNGPEKLG